MLKRGEKQQQVRLEDQQQRLFPGPLEQQFDVVSQPEPEDVKSQRLPWYPGSPR